MQVDATGWLKRTYRAVVPVRVRQSLAVDRLKRWWIACLPHDAVYDKDYYLNVVDKAAAASAEVIADSISVDLRPTTVIDVGCGAGALLVALRGRGATVAGLEYSAAGLEICRERNLDVRRFDLERDVFDSGESFDVAVSMEVAEHLPEGVADRYVALLARIAPCVVFTAAPPGQGGTDHVNEQPRSYWVEKFRRHGFETRAELAAKWSAEWKRRDVVGWYWMNLMVFERTSCRRNDVVE
ncbi:MAG: class I SAM-dependent methyltransferase [Thermoanaerobaculia bacterium]